MEPTPNASLVVLKELAQRATKGPWRSSGSSIEADSLYRLAYTNSFHADWRQNADYIAAASPDVVLVLLQQLAAADAASHQLRSEACGLHAELSDLRKYKTNQEWLAQMRAGYPQKAASEAADALATQLAAAEARATEAAAEAGKWKAEARAHAARCAVLEKADPAPYCEGQCGICDCITAPVAPQQQEGGGQ